MVSKLSEIDQVLIRYADTLSLNALSFKIGGLLTPEQCGARIALLLDAPDWLTAAQQDQLVTMKMRQIVTSLEEMTLTTRSAEVMLRGLEMVGARLDKRAEATTKDLTTLYAFQGNVMLDAVAIALGHLRGALLTGADGKIDPAVEAKWDNALESALRFAQIELTKHEAEVVDSFQTVELPASAVSETTSTSGETPAANPAKKPKRELPTPVIPTRGKS